MCGPLICAYAYVFIHTHALPTTAHFTANNHYALRLAIFQSLLTGTLPKHPETTYPPDDPDTTYPPDDSETPYPPASPETPYPPEGPCQMEYG